MKYLYHIAITLLVLPVISLFINALFLLLGSLFKELIFDPLFLGDSTYSELLIESDKIFITNWRIIYFGFVITYLSYIIKEKLNENSRFTKR